MIPEFAVQIDPNSIAESAIEIWFISRFIPYLTSFDFLPSEVPCYGPYVPVVSLRSSGVPWVPRASGTLRWHRPGLCESASRTWNQPWRNQHGGQDFPDKRWVSPEEKVERFVKNMSVQKDGMDDWNRLECIFVVSCFWMKVRGSITGYMIFLLSSYSTPAWPMAHGLVISWRQAKRWIWDIPHGNYLYIVDCWMPSGRMKNRGGIPGRCPSLKNFRLPGPTWGPILWKISVVWKAERVSRWWLKSGIHSPVGGQVVCPIIYSAIPGGCWGISEPSTVWSVASSSRFHHGAMSVEAASMRFVLTEAGIIIADDFC